MWLLAEGNLGRLPGGRGIRIGEEDKRGRVIGAIGCLGEAYLVSDEAGSTCASD